MTKYNIKTVVDKMQTKYKYQKLFNDHQIHKNYSKLCKFVYTQFQSLVSSWYQYLIRYFIPNNNDTKSKSYEEKLFLNKITKFNI